MGKTQENPVHESEQDFHAYVRMNRQNGGMGENGVMGEWRVFLVPHMSEEESPLVEWARGQGWTVLPHPPPLSNNCPN